MLSRQTETQLIISCQIDLRNRLHCKISGFYTDLGLHEVKHGL